VNDEQERSELVTRLRRFSRFYSGETGDMLVAAADALESLGNFVQDVADHGLRTDMTPTVMFYAFNRDRREGEQDMYMRMTSYFQRGVDNLKQRAKETLDG